MWVAGIPLPFRHTRSVQRVSIFLPSYPRFQAGIHPKGTPDGCPIKNVGHDRLFSSSPHVGGRDPSPLPSYPQCVAGIHPKGNPDGCPIKNVGHDADEDGFPIKNVGHDSDGDGCRYMSSCYLRRGLVLSHAEELRMTPWYGARIFTLMQPFSPTLDRSSTLLNPALFLESNL